MRYTLSNGKTVNIPVATIEKNMRLLDMSKEDAIAMWLDDNGYTVNEEQAELDAKASKEKISCDARTIKERRNGQPRTTKVSDEKKELFDSIVQNLTRCVPVEQENIKILTQNKLIQVQIGEKTFKIDLIEQRKPKK